MSDCSHDDLVIATQIDELEPGSEPLCIRVWVRCDNCGQPFSWRGLNSGVANADGPVTSADGYELRAPIVPRPGGVVGLLALAGLESRLDEIPRASDAEPE